ncbi:MAG: DNA polymerase I [Actinomycetota bacterium]|nr:DNA polymerase I [Actinomycetota bacterium]
MVASTPESRRWVLIDGHSLAYRAFYALPAEMATSSGQPTNAVFGFVSMLIKVLEELRPEAMVVAFDRGRPEFRTERFAEYKAHRKPMPDELRDQMGVIHAVLEALGITALEVEGYEADDLLATLATTLAPRDEVFIVTGDRDALQLVDERVRIIANRKGITDITVYDPAAVRERFGVDPSQIVDYLALKGDVSDNIPGVPGIGEKTAAALIARFGSLEGVYEHLDEITPPKVRRALEENRESAFMSRELATARRDVPLPLAGLESCVLRPWDDGELYRIMDSLEFRKHYERLSQLRRALFPSEKEEGGEGEADSEGVLEVTEVGDEEALGEMLRHLAREGEVSIYPALKGEGFTRGSMEAMALAAGERLYHLDLRSESGVGMLRSFLEWVSENRGLRIDIYRGKDFMVQCQRLCGLHGEVDFDVELASYLVNPSGVRHDLESICGRYLGAVRDAAPPAQMALVEEEEGAVATARLARAVGDLVPALEAEMALRELQDLYREVEMPLEAVLAEMEINGIRLDPSVLAEMEAELKEELSGLERRAYELAGEEFNINSPQQLARVLFEVLGLPPRRRTKTGYATDVAVLQSLEAEHPIAGVILRYRELSKLLNTYITALPRLVDPRTGRLHACFNQTVTSTGRLSSSNPNLQNIPVRTALGRSIRKAFLPTTPGGCIISADYSQIELRVMAHLSQDPGLKLAFEEDRDIHASTASEVFGIPFQEVTPEHRRRAKAINFGIIYGISPFGLAEQLGIEQEEAEEYITRYFREFPGVRAFLDRQVELAASRGYVTTILGRRREIPELAQGNVRLRRLGERLAFNTPIQGSAADIIKLAMLRVYRRMREEGCRSRMVLQVHDELVFDVVEGEESAMMEIARHEMENAFRLHVPLKVEVSRGSSWYDAK